MPKGSVPRKGSRTAARLSNERALSKSPTGRQRTAKAAHEWNEYRAAGTDTAGAATKSLRKSMRDVRSDKSAKRGTSTVNKFRKDK